MKRVVVGQRGASLLPSAQFHIWTLSSPSSAAQSPINLAKGKRKEDEKWFRGKERKDGEKSVFLSPLFSGSTTRTYRPNVDFFFAYFRCFAKESLLFHLVYSVRRSS